MPNILKSFMNQTVKPYQFPGAEELVVDPEPASGVGEGEGDAEAEQQQQPDFASYHADALLRDARRQAEELLEEARAQAEAEAEGIRKAARERGYRDGLTEGMAVAGEETRRLREAQAEELEASVKQFLEKAELMREEFLSQTADDLRDLAIAVAEKVIRISLKSSGEIISRMILAATEKHRRTEWVHIYIANCDAKAMARTPPALAAALAGLSDRVRIIPMADDESGTCIIEMPDEIIDASVSTQLANIKTLLTDAGTKDRNEAQGVQVGF